MTATISAPLLQPCMFSLRRRTRTSLPSNHCSLILALPKTTQQRRRLFTSLRSSLIDGQRSSPLAFPDELSPPQSDYSEAEAPIASPSLSGCQACGREEKERGCNGSGRIQGGIATIPGFGWWPIKAYRPCPGFLASGGRYKRQGQSMDEVVSGASKATRDETRSRIN